MSFSARIFLVSALLFPAAWSQDTRDFRQFLDKRASPCEDFHQYACGKWTPNNIDATDVLSDQNIDNRYTLKQHYASLQRRGSNDNLASEFYHLCVNSKVQAREDILRPYLAALAEISEWPHLNSTFKAGAFNWLLVAAKLRRYGVDTLFRLSVQRNWKDSRQHLAYLTPLRWTFHGRLLDEDAAFMYKTYVKYVLLALGVRVRRALEVAQEVVDFETQLDNLNWDVKDDLNEPISLDALKRELPGLNWSTYFEALLGEPAKRSQRLIVQVDLFKKLEQLLAKTRPETVALSQLSRFLRHYQVQLDDPTWMQCMDEVNLKMPLIVAKNFRSLRRSFTLSRVWRLFENIREEFERQINATSWYEAKSKDELMNKLASIGMLTDYPEMRPRIHPEIDRHSYQKSRMLLDRLFVKNEFDLLTGSSVPVNRNLNPLNVNAHYKLTTNTLELPIGILQPPIYREHANWAQVTGSLGTIIAHELVHGFDFDGQGYDANGNVKSETSPKILIQFGSRANCFLDQYSGGRSGTLNEDIADSEGLRLAYGAYKRFQGEHHAFVDPEFSADQLFFISFAQVWCQSGRPAGTGTHSSHKVRVNNAVSNADHFAAAFSCRRGWTLNPAKKCQIWK